MIVTNPGWLAQRLGEVAEELEQEITDATKETLANCAKVYLGSSTYLFPSDDPQYGDDGLFIALVLDGDDDPLWRQPFDLVSTLMSPAGELTHKDLAFFEELAHRLLAAVKEERALE
jgi:hypothetical protein